MIVLRDVNKKIENKHIIKDCTFHIKQGECVGLLGKNGAGKTTLLNLMTGILMPDSGFLRVNQTENLLETRETLKKVAYISGVKSQLWQDLRVKDSFENCTKMYGVREDKLNELIHLCEIDNLLDNYPGSLSLGEKMRCEIVYALLANPSILLMDEVMIGLDLTVRQRIFEYLLSKRAEKKTTIIYTSHNLTEVERLCNRILLIDNGGIIFDGSMERIMREYAPLYQLKVELWDDTLPDFEDLPVRKITMDKEQICIFFDNKEIEKVELIKFVTNKCNVKDLKLMEPDLEETVRKIYIERAGGC